MLLGGGNSSAISVGVTRMSIEHALRLFSMLAKNESESKTKNGFHFLLAHSQPKIYLIFLPKCRWAKKSPRFSAKNEPFLAEESEKTAHRMQFSKKCLVKNWPFLFLAEIFGKQTAK